MTTGETEEPATEPGEAELYRDPRSFQKPLDEAISICTGVLTESVPKIDGSEAALRDAMDDLEALEAFVTAVEGHLRDASFHQLPSVRHWGRRMTGLHQLHSGPFRGVFLIGRDPRQVVALLFSRKPHDMSKRLDELAAPYRARQAKEPEAAPEEPEATP